MDFGIKNPVAGHSPNIDEKARAWGNVEGDMLYYLSDIDRLEEFANRAQDAEQLATYVEPFLDNARRYFEAMEQISKGQVEWTDLRQKFGGVVAEAIAKIRKANAEFAAQLEQIDAKDRSAMLIIEQKRKHTLEEIAADLNQTLQAELFRHQNRINTIQTKDQVNQQRQAIQESLRVRRQELLQRARYGSKANQLVGDRIPVTVQQTTAPSNSISVSGQPRHWGQWWSNVWNGLGNR